MWRERLSRWWARSRRLRRREEQLTYEDALEDLQDPSPDVRQRGVGVLLRLGGEKATAPLLAALDDPEEWVRFAAACTLGRLKVEAALDRLISLLAEDPSGLVRLGCVDALEEFEDPRLPEVLTAALRDEDNSVVSSACSALARRRIDSAVPQLLDVLSHPRRNVFKAACGALLALGYADEKMLVMLEALASDAEYVEHERVEQRLHEKMKATIAVIRGEPAAPPEPTVSQLLEQARQLAPSVDEASPAGSSSLDAVPGGNTDAARP